MKLSKTKQAILALIAANVIWGMGPSIFKWSFANVHIFTLAFLRSFIPAILLGIIFNKNLTFKKQDLKIILAIGLCDITLNIGLYFIGVLYTASINVPIIASASPVFLILGSMIFLKEKPTKRMLLGNLIGMAGVLIIVVQPLFQHAEHASVFGNILVVLSAISAVMGTILSKKIIKNYPATTITFWSFAVGSITFFPFFLYETLTYGFLPHLTSQGIIGIMYGAFFSSLIAYFLSYWSLKYFLASQTGVFSYLDPVAGILLAIPLLGEYPTPLFLLGSFLVFYGIYIAERRINYHPFHKLLEPD